MRVHIFVYMGKMGKKILLLLLIWFIDDTGVAYFKKDRVLHKCAPGSGAELDHPLFTCHSS